MILVIDSDSTGLQQSEMVIKACCGNRTVVGFTHPMLAIKFAANNPIGAVFTRANMRMMDGFDVMRLIHQFHHDIPVYFVEDNAAYETQAMQDGAKAYLVKPLTQEQVHRVCGR